MTFPPDGLVPPGGPTPPSGQASVLIPPVPALVAGLRRVAVLTPDGEMETLSPQQAFQEMKAQRPMVCHLRATAMRMNCPGFYCHDVLELYAFVRPARFCLPTIGGLCSDLGLPLPEGLEESTLSLVGCVESLLEELTTLPQRELGLARSTAWAMTRGGWAWGQSVLAALGASGELPHRSNVVAGFRVWEHLPEISEYAPEPPASHHPVAESEARERLAALLSRPTSDITAAGGSAAVREERPQQADFAAALTAAFAPRQAEGEPTVILAEAGTGTGKTLGYIAPASLWAEKNEGSVWISTYTRNLQRQLDRELDRLHPDPVEKSRQVVVRKGRENYLCLLNLEDAVHRFTEDSSQAVALGLMSRWALHTRDGDMVGGDFPGWLVDVVGTRASTDLLDRRGECIFSACAHYNKCFIERSARKSRRARLVVANHALVMMQASAGGMEDGTLSPRLIFDEGHHVFDAADSAFSAHLTGQETAELRRWLLGGDAGRSRARGLQRRAEEVVSGDDASIEALDAILHAAGCLPVAEWRTRIADGTPHGVCEAFLAAVRQQVYARSPDAASPYSLETGVVPLAPGVPDAAEALAKALGFLSQPVRAFISRLNQRLDDESSSLESALRLRMESLAKSLDRRALQPLQAWVSMLESLHDSPPEEFVDWFSVDRYNGTDYDMGMHRHWIDPTIPFVRTVATPAHGVVIASATLCDGSGNSETDWKAAEARTGALHLPSPALRTVVASPFPYPEITRVLLVNDIPRDDIGLVAAACRELFLAAEGGALGLFTAISRLRAVHQRIAGALDDAGLPLYAQHVDGLDTSTLVDIFRTEEDACLLGTDAVRDGVDVPGRSLRLIVFDRIPWPRPDILHKARRNAFGGSAYDDRLTRLKLKQAFGRLVRRTGDRGVFVLLDGKMPARLAGAFPPGVGIERVGLAQAISITRDFLKVQDAT